MSRNGASDDLVITVTATGKTVTVKGQFQGFGLGNLQFFTFADGTVWTAQDVKQKLLDQESAAIGGSIYGYGNSNDTLVAGLGDKYLNGEGGADTYVYASAGGNDVIDDGGSRSTLIFTDIKSTDVYLSRGAAARDLSIYIGATGKAVTVKGQFDWQNLGTLQTITFAESVTLSAAQISAVAGTDVLTAGAGDQTLPGDGGARTYVYSPVGGNDVIDDGGNQSKLAFLEINATDASLTRNGASNDLVLIIGTTGKTLTVKGQFDGSGHGTLQSFSFADGTAWTAQQVKQMLLGQESSASSGSIYGYANSNDTLVAGGGDKYLNGEGGADTYVYSSGGGNDIIDDGGSQSKLAFSDLNLSDVALGRVGASSDLVVTDNGTGKTVTVKGQYDPSGKGTLTSLTFADATVLSAQQVKRLLLDQESAASSGSIYGYANSNDTLVAGAGDKYLNGEGGADTYVCSFLSGNDVIDDGGSQSNLVFGDINPTDITLGRVGASSDLIITNINTEKSVTVKGQFEPSGHGTLQTFAFADGTVWTAQQVKQMLLDRESAASSGSIYGYAGSNDTLSAGAGDKYLNGEGGADAYVYSSTGGNDVIDDGGSQSKLVFSDINSTDVTYSVAGTGNTDLVITVGGSGKTVTVKGQLSSNHVGTLQTFTFADGVTLNAAQVASLTGPVTILAGTGDKTLSGNGGTVTYVYSSAGGNDVIDDGANQSKLVFSDINSSDVAFSTSSQNSNDLVMTIGSTGKTVTVEGQFSSNANGTLQCFTFADGVSWNAWQVHVLGGGNVVFAGTGDRTLNGNWGQALTYVYAYEGGNDVINDGGSQSHLVLLDTNSTGATLSRDGSSWDMVITIVSTGKTIKVQGEFTPWNGGTLQTIAFADGVSWSAAQVRQSLLDQESAANGGSVYGYGNSNDTLAAELGDKYLNGEGGTDTYVYASAGGSDVIDDGGNQSTLDMQDIALTGVTLWRNGGSWDMGMTVNATGKTITVKGEFTPWNGGTLQTITFADGVSWSAPQVRQKLLDQESAANGGSVYGYSNSNDTLVAGLGEKYLNGEGGTDTYIYTSAGGNDVIDDGGSQSTFVMQDINSTGVTLWRDGGSWDLGMTVNSTGKTITMKGEFTPWNGGTLQAITFADGVSWSATQVRQMLLDHESSANGGSVYGYSNSNDTLVAGLGDKYLNREGGTDTYMYTSAGGNDVIDDGGSQSALVMQDIDPSNVILTRNGSAWELGMTVNSTGKNITVKGEFTSWNGGTLHAITFADGTSWTAQQVSSFILGGTEDDTLTGTSGNDIFYGSPGNDVLYGGGGSDTYRIGSNIGHTTINNVDPNGATTPSGEVDFATGLSANKLWFQQSGNDLEVDLLGTASKLTVAGWYGANGSAQVNSFDTADGSKLDSQINQLVAAMAAYSANNSGFNPATVPQMPNDSSLQSALAASWHH